MEIRFDGKLALITGASGGIGAAIALRLDLFGSRNEIFVPPTRRFEAELR